MADPVEFSEDYDRFDWLVDADPLRLRDEARRQAREIAVLQDVVRQLAPYAPERLPWMMHSPCDEVYKMLTSPREDDR